LRARRDLLCLACGFALAFAGAACRSNSFRSARVTNQTGDPVAVINLASMISVPEGSAASAHIELISYSDNVLGGGDIQSTDPSILQVVASATDPSGYVFLGVRAGATRVQVTVNGQPVQTVNATVPGPPASSLPPTIDAGVPPVVSVDGGAPDGDAASAGD
jgi:hypothetical protein